MIAPVTKDQHEYVEALAVHLLRAREQVEAGDKPGSVAFTDAFRSLVAWGEKRYARENAGLVEYAETLAADNPERLRAVMARQNEVIAAADLAAARVMGQIADEADAPEPNADPLAPARTEADWDAQGWSREPEAAGPAAAKPKRARAAKPKDEAKSGPKKEMRR